MARNKLFNKIVAQNFLTLGEKNDHLDIQRHFKGQKDVIKKLKMSFYSQNTSYAEE